MNETMMTLAGWLGSDPRMFRTQAGPVVHFRVGTTPRRLNRRTGEWTDAPTQWHSVTAWRSLADNCARSLRRGQAVVVHGRLNATTFVNKDGVEVTGYEVEALYVGHDLNRGHSQFFKNASPESASLAGAAGEQSVGGRSGGGAGAEESPVPWATPGTEIAPDGDAEVASAGDPELDAGVDSGVDSGAESDAAAAGRAA